MDYKNFNFQIWKEKRVLELKFNVNDDMSLESKFKEHTDKYQSISFDPGNLQTESKIPENLQFPDNSFDLVISPFLFQNISFQKSSILVAEIVRVLQVKGGYFVFSLQAINDWFSEESSLNKSTNTNLNEIKKYNENIISDLLDKYFYYTIKRSQIDRIEETEPLYQNYSDKISKISKYFGSRYLVYAKRKPYSAISLNGGHKRLSPLDYYQVNKKSDKMKKYIEVKPYRGTGFLNSLNRLIELRRIIHESNVIYPTDNFSYVIESVTFLMEEKQYNELEKVPWCYADSWRSRNNFTFNHNIKKALHHELENITYKDRVEMNRVFYNYFMFRTDVVEKPVFTFKENLMKDHLLDLSEIPGLHIRTIRHHAEADENISFDDYIQKYIDLLDPNEKIIYVATHIQKPIDVLKEKGYTVIHTDQKRSLDERDDWTEHYKEISKEYSDVLVDTLLLSSCKKLIGGRSNVVLSAAWMNPNIDIQIVDFGSIR
jgi:hypothetical protein